MLFFCFLLGWWVAWTWWALVSCVVGVVVWMGGDVVGEELDTRAWSSGPQEGALFPAGTSSPPPDEGVVRGTSVEWWRVAILLVSPLSTHSCGHERVINGS